MQLNFSNQIPQEIWAIAPYITNLNLNIYLVFIILFISGCTVFEFNYDKRHPSISQNKILTVFAAASLIEPFTELGIKFEETHPDTNIVFSYAGSQQIAQQISQGAPLDLFASADETQMDAVIESGRIDPGMVTPFTINSLVVVLPYDNPADLESLQHLANPGVKLILADGVVPVGKYSLQFLENASRRTNFGPDYKNKVLQNVISFETNVKAVLSKVILGEADAGIVYTSDATSTEHGKISILPIPVELNVLATYYIAPIKDSPQKTLSRAFIDFILSPTGQSILGEYGFDGYQ